MLHEPFYDPDKTYYENWEEGPFGGFADGVTLPESEPRFDFLGRKISYPFGIPAGPLVNAAFMRAAMEKGFDAPVYKTVRSREKKCNEWPNVLPVDVSGDLTLRQAAAGLTVKDSYAEPLAITNSFGNPSYPPEVWRKDVRELMAYAKGRPGQAVSGMVEGTRWSPDASEKDFIADWAEVAKLMNETGVHSIELNLSCPNEGDLVKRLLCYDAALSATIIEAIRKKIGATPLVVKVSYFESDEELRAFVETVGPLVDGIAAINTISAPVRKADGTQALPGGEWRLKSGICGAPVKWAGLDMTKRLTALRKELGMRYSVIGVGGVTTPADFRAYRDAGADVVMSATGAMWNPYLAREIKAAYPDG
ncbi:MAG: diguanylate cyclase [Patescibacteria group bacterium]|nr:diguanylate cyclase [Patescibacteria group bacterium]MDE1966086.1 diguanylate cyclase [Patescibacteria group bacterium]